VAGAGLIGLGVGGIVALGAKSRYGEASSHCTGQFCDPTGLDIRDEARSRGTVATVIGGIGLAAMAAGAVLFFTAPSAATGSTGQRMRLTPTASAGPGWLTFGGAW